MKVTVNGEEGRKLQSESYPQKEPVVQGGYVGVPIRVRMTENNAANTDNQSMCKLKNRRIPNGTYGGVGGATQLMGGLLPD